jgi:hypothetical protein
MTCVGKAGAFRFERRGVSSSPDKPEKMIRELDRKKRSPKNSEV